MLTRDVSTTKRFCRCGAGVEQTIGGADTPGFPLVDQDVVTYDDFKGIHVLNLKRSEGRMKQTSTLMLQSWRANCDVQLIIYDSDPNTLDISDVARITSYVVAYTCKGSLSARQEHDSIAALIKDSESLYEEHDLFDKARITRQILNSFFGKRIISKAECCFNVLSLPLVLCTENFDRISTTSYQKLHSSSYTAKRAGECPKSVSDKNWIKRYSERKEELEHMSFIAYYHHIKAIEMAKSRSQKKSAMLFKPCKENFFIPVTIGLGCMAVYPVNERNGLSYARTTLIFHKPWSKRKPLNFENRVMHQSAPDALINNGNSLNKMIISEYHEFIQSTDCPKSVTYRNSKAKAVHEKKQSGLNIADDTYENDVIDSPFDNSSLWNTYERNDEHNEILTCCSFVGRKNTDYSTLDKGLNHDWSKRINDNKDKEKTGCSWLDIQVSNLPDCSSEKNIPLQTSGLNMNQPYDISHVDSNEQQADIVYSVIEKLKEWVEFPKVIGTDKEYDFNPLRMTVIGAGGTGKSFVINVLRTAIESIFPESVVSHVTAPTGAASYGVGGTTCHSFFKVNIKNTNSDIIGGKKEKLEESLNRTVMMLFDERGLLSMDVFGCCERNARICAHKGLNQTSSWGGIPIIIILGDDHQLPSVVTGNKGRGATHILCENDKILTLTTLNNEKRGRDNFLECAKNVKELKTSQRVQTNADDLKHILHNLRESDGCTDAQAEKLLMLHIEHHALTKERKKYLEENALFVYTTKHEVAEHNFKKMTKLVNINNPLANVTRKLSTTEYTMNHKPNPKHFDYSDLQRNSTLCKNARVSLTRNYIPHWGLYNGSLGTVTEIVYEKGCSPNKGDFPAYVTVQFDSYKGQQWDHASCCNEIPIPVATDICQHGCCKMTYVPLKLAFAKTVHTTQGAEAGPDKNIKAIVFSPGTDSFEGINPGTLYTGISRASTLGNGNIEDSSLYFCSPTACKSRFKNVKFKKNSNEIKYKRVEQRERWIQYLHKHKTNNKFSEEQRTHLKNWVKCTKISKQDLDDIIIAHAQHNKR